MIPSHTSIISQRLHATPSTQHPARSTQHATPSTQHPALNSLPFDARCSMWHIMLAEACIWANKYSAWFCQPAGVVLCITVVIGLPFQHNMRYLRYEIWYTYTAGVGTLSVHVHCRCRYIVSTRTCMCRYIVSTCMCRYIVSTCTCVHHICDYIFHSSGGSKQITLVSQLLCLTR